MSLPRKEKIDAMVTFFTAETPRYIPELKTQQFVLTCIQNTAKRLQDSKEEDSILTVEAIHSSLLYILTLPSSFFEGHCSFEMFEQSKENSPEQEAIIMSHGKKKLIVLFSDSIHLLGEKALFIAHPRIHQWMCHFIIDNPTYHVVTWFLTRAFFLLQPGVIENHFPTILNCLQKTLENERFFETLTLLKTPSECKSEADKKSNAELHIHLDKILRKSFNYTTDLTEAIGSFYWFNWAISTNEFCDTEIAEMRDKIIANNDNIKSISIELKDLSHHYPSQIKNREAVNILIKHASREHPGQLFKLIMKLRNLMDMNIFRKLFFLDKHDTAYLAEYPILVDNLHNKLIQHWTAFPVNPLTFIQIIDSTIREVLSEYINRQAPAFKNQIQAQLPAGVKVETVPLGIIEHVLGQYMIGSFFPSITKLRKTLENLSRMSVAEDIFAEDITISQSSISL